MQILQNIAGFSNQCVCLQGTQHILKKLVHWGVSTTIYLSSTVHQLNKGLGFIGNAVALARMYWWIYNCIIKVIIIFI